MHGRSDSADGGVEEVVDVVGHVHVVQGGGMGIVAQGRDGISVAQPGLSLEDLSFADQLSADAVAEAVKRSVGEAGGEPESFEAMREQVGSAVS